MESAQKVKIRWWVLLLLFIAIYSFVYCYDNPYAIQNQLIDEYGLSQVQYNLLYGVYGYVNFIAPLIAGLLIDFIGINTSTVIFYTLIVVGHSFWVIACFKNINNYSLMVIGRAIFGVGAEQFHTSRKWLLYEYFTGNEYYFASALSLSSSRLGSASQSYVSTYLYNKHGIVSVLIVGWVLVIFSFILIAIFLMLFRQHKKASLSKFTVQLLEPGQTDDALSDEIELAANSKNSSEQNKFNLVSLCKDGYDRRWWFLGFTLIFFYSTYLSYSNVGSAFLQNRYQYKYEESNSLAPITFWIAAIFTPIYGFICDYYGKRPLMMLFSGLSLLLGHILLGFIGSAERSMAIPIFGLIFLGSGYSLGAAAVWPSFGLIVKQKYLATTLGIWGSIDNGFQAMASLIVGILTKDYTEEQRKLYTDQYDNARYLWIVLAIGTILWTLLLWYSDKTQFDNALWLPETKFIRKSTIHMQQYDMTPTDRD